MWLAISVFFLVKKICATVTLKYQYICPIGAAHYLKIELLNFTIMSGLELRCLALLTYLGDKHSLILKMKKIDKEKNE